MDRSEQRAFLIRRLLDEDSRYRGLTLPEGAGEQKRLLRSLVNEGWYAAARRYEGFLRDHARERILFLELGVGGNTPGIIKVPFLRMTAQNPDATYACVNWARSLPWDRSSGSPSCWTQTSARCCMICNNESPPPRLRPGRWAFVIHHHKNRTSVLFSCFAAGSMLQ